MRRKVLFFATCTLFLLLCGGCGKSVSEKVLKEDLQVTAYSDNYSGETIDKVEITEYEYDKKQKGAYISCVVESNDGEASYKRPVDVIYDCSDTSNKHIIDAKFHDESEWEIKPIGGVLESKIVEYISGTTLEINDDNWVIEEEKIESISVVEHITELENEIDKVVLDIKLEDTIEEASGKVQVTFSFDNGWRLSDFSYDDVQVLVKPGMEHVVTDDALTSNLTSLVITFDNEDVSKISISDEEISNFKLEDKKTVDKGCMVTYTCSAEVDKDVASFTVSYSSTYQYGENGWELSTNFVNSVEITKYDLIGTWEGEYPEDGGLSYGKAVLEITEVSESGTISGVYSFSASKKSTTPYNGSYTVTGTIDANTMRMTLSAGDWVVSPAKTHSFVNSKENIVATLDVENRTIKGKAQSRHDFTVCKQ